MAPDEFVTYIDEYTRLKPSMLMAKLELVKKTSVAGGEREPASASAAVAAVEQELAAPEISAPGAAAGEQKELPVPVPETTERSPAETVDDDEEPMEGETMYKLRIRLPDGTIIAKEFGCKRRVASLFAFCRSASAVRDGGEQAEQKAFRIMRFAGGGAFEAVRDDGGATFEDLRLNCAAASVVFDT
ncbi:hypothetical protein BAE44_0025765 [Dichanthelium oligosanthes]|uniref:UBX domain-containing protein n=1 Tax=Dichanthelium oligosanthes TaxID=888268 RepID=A0A1E5UK43_9POAL|nr:hypothetical protein BAE44_0025765 [Dichanthelium oligosanthes]